uniref:FCP1 homology domain-containing protein n=1 Tax=Chromera velia CCMP2878 TaxID=1169474 RepID=A0A0G4GDF7_9ALVE|eukprot:Cvel_21386.t1-p1 / transcript=Cvel_21386.t1 / gene=Cvel_21386 / organism=Chromera_velia_CCMP2878 / gene_product=CTD small phosphatase-like protein 2, putative / transcript_product=CTD small phosphatase-like protein 2, putative / location=Cvel_scaffold2001:15542-21481(+) / protein_length=819 / sequence_SO=supercontig / SO=protein_coding / is_pseudo=false
MSVFRSSLAAQRRSSSRPAAGEDLHEKRERGADRGGDLSDFRHLEDAKSVNINRRSLVSSVEDVIGRTPSHTHKSRAAHMPSSPTTSSLLRNISSKLNSHSPAPGGTKESSLSFGTRAPRSSSISRQGDLRQDARGGGSRPTGGLGLPIPQNSQDRQLGSPLRGGTSGAGVESRFRIDRDREREHERERIRKSRGAADSDVRGRHLPPERDQESSSHTHGGGAGGADIGPTFMASLNSLRRAFHREFASHAALQFSGGAGGGGSGVPTPNRSSQRTGAGGTAPPAAHRRSSRAPPPGSAAVAEEDDRDLHDSTEKPGGGRSLHGASAGGMSGGPVSMAEKYRRGSGATSSTLASQADNTGREADRERERGDDSTAGKGEVPTRGSSLSSSFLHRQQQHANGVHGGAATTTTSGGGSGKGSGVSSSPYGSPSSHSSGQREGLAAASGVASASTAQQSVGGTQSRSSRAQVGPRRASVHGSSAVTGSAGEGNGTAGGGIDSSHLLSLSVATRQREWGADRDREGESTGAGQRGGRDANASTTQSQQQQPAQNQLTLPPQVTTMADYMPAGGQFFHAGMDILSHRTPGHRGIDVGKLPLPLRNAVLYLAQTRPSKIPKSKKGYLPKKTCDKDITLVLDLDETLMHCRPERIPGRDPDTIVRFDDSASVGFVYFRPHVRDFLERCAKAFEVVVFTASTQNYADQVINKLDPQRLLIKHRLYRPHCTENFGGYTKDLRNLGRAMDRTILVDNSPISLAPQLDNGILCLSWFGDSRDHELHQILKELKHVADTRPSPVYRTLADRYGLRAWINSNRSDAPLANLI